MLNKKFMKTKLKCTGNFKLQVEVYFFFFDGCKLKFTGPYVYFPSTVVAALFSASFNACPPSCVKRMEKIQARK